MSKISDVARKAGVSPATVSRVFNQPDLVTPDKRDRVLEAARALEYQPTQAARNLRTGAVNTITALVGDISQPFHGALGRALSRVGDARGFRVLLYDLDHREDRLVRMLNELTTTDTHGVVLATANDLGTDAVLKAVEAAQARGLVVVSSSQQRSPTLPAVIPRYQAISHLATLHMAMQGCERMVLISGSNESPLTRERRSGFERACAELGFADDASATLDGQFTIAGSREAFAAFLRARAPGDRRPVGVVCVNMKMAIGVLQAAAECGVAVPAEACVVCCEDIPLAEEWNPSVTTVGIDFDVLAETTLAVLLKGKDAPPVTHLPHRLEVRQSSRRQAEDGGQPLPDAS